jgi:hypothetical protein
MSGMEKKVIQIQKKMSLFYKLPKTHQNNNQAHNLGRAIAQAVSRWLPTAAVRGSRPGRHVGFLWWKKWRRGRFPPSTSVSPAKFIPPIAPKNHHHQSINHRGYVMSMLRLWPQYKGLIDT